MFHLQGTPPLHVMTYFENHRTRLFRPFILKARQVPSFPNAPDNSRNSYSKQVSLLFTQTLQPHINALINISKLEVKPKNATNGIPNISS
jgi:hypothetical protein